MALFGAPALACSVEDIHAVASVGSELERERELDKYESPITTAKRLHAFTH
jgi:hypothetical protein